MIEWAGAVLLMIPRASVHGTCKAQALNIGGGSGLKGLRYIGVQGGLCVCSLSKGAVELRACGAKGYSTRK